MWLSERCKIISGTGKESISQRKAFHQPLNQSNLIDFVRNLTSPGRKLQSRKFLLFRLLFKVSLGKEIGPLIYFWERKII